MARNRKRTFGSLASAYAVLNSCNAAAAPSAPVPVPTQTSINGKPAAWSPEILALWQAKLAGKDWSRPVTHANYFTPRPAVDEYNRGSDREGFVYTLAGRDVCILQWRSECKS